MALCDLASTSISSLILFFASSWSLISTYVCGSSISNVLKYVLGHAVPWVWTAFITSLFLLGSCSALSSAASSCDPLNLLHSHDRRPQTGWLKWQKCIILQFCSCKIWNQDVVRVPSEAVREGPRQWFEDLRLFPVCVQHCPWIYVSVSGVPISPFYKDIRLGLT